MLDLDNFLRMAIAQGVSDIHLRVGLPPVLRKDGDMIITKIPALTEEALQLFIKKIIPDRIVPRLRNKTDFDFSFMMDELCRFRVNLFYEMGQVGLVMRLITLDIPEIETLGHPSVVRKLAEFHKGLVLVTGPTGSGKSTTLAALLNTINLEQKKHIVTLEDPVEYVYRSKQSVVTQRQLGIDTDTFPNGIKYALRQDPDVILIGEMRDRETMLAALHAAETGHMVYSTLHTTDSVQTIHRIINAFEPYERDAIRHQVAQVLQGTLSQRLVKRNEGRGRIAVAEIMLVSPAIRDYVIREQTEEIYQLLTSSAFEGIKSLNHSLYLAVKNNLIKPEDALANSENETELQQMLRGAFHGTNTY
ncbi:MAG: PilT/PilU family type 4a pilus ATPase [Cyanobacteria bacterium P01_H01_bin.74]